MLLLIQLFDFLIELNRRLRTLPAYPTLKKLKKGILRMTGGIGDQMAFAVAFVTAEDLESFLQVAPIVLLGHV